MRELCVRTAEDGAIFSAPNSINAITTYVLLEQEAWFEKEVAFVRRWIKPGMTAIDIGANLGIYSLPLARRVGPHGMVFAYEPGAQPRSFLEHSRTIARADVESRKESAVSMMPDDQLKPMKDAEVRALIAYLQSPVQTPILATPDNVKDFGQADQFQQTLECGGPFGPNSTYCDTILR